MDLHSQTRRQSVDRRYAHPVKAAGDGVRLAAELAAGVQRRHDRLDGRHTGRLVDVGGDAAAVVLHPDAAVLLNMDVHFGATAGHELVDGVVHHLKDELV